MGAESSLPWADRIFGSDAADLRQAVVKALAAACSQSQGAQDAAGLGRSIRSDRASGRFSSKSWQTG